MAEVVGGAFLSSFLNVVFERLSSPAVVNWIQGKKLDQKLLLRLETILNVLQAVLNDAEQKQITDPAIRNWLSNVEDAVYIADDLLDEISTRAAVKRVLRRPGNTFWSRYLNFRRVKLGLRDRKVEANMVAEIEEVVDTLETMARHKDILGLRKIAEENMSWRTPSTSLVERSDVYGRDEDKEAIVKLLLDDGDKISVIPIVGMGGVGKTTLAKLVYHEERVKQSFDFRVWVCVGDEFDIVKFTRTIIEAIDREACTKNDLNLLQHDLKEKLTGKRFLVVLDDMWNDNYDVWKAFQNPFHYGSKGSRVLVTTRNDTVASRVQTVQAYKLSLLSDEFCWQVFAKHASLSTDSLDYLALEKVGRRIADKCKGLPLAAQTLGGLLRTKDDVREWNDVLKSEIWEFSENESRILPALRISYHYLPSYLKRCFVYCSLYPKDYQFDREELILLWMAEDLIQPGKNGSTLEEIGYKYFNDLTSRSFFQPSNTKEKSFVMHDMMHDIATFYAREFYFRASELGIAALADTKTRHLSYDVNGNYPLSKFVEACDSLKHVRTLLQINFHPSLKEVTPCLSFLEWKCLRALSFKAFPLDNDSLPNSIGELFHLRYLDLSHTDILALPESLSNLYNLQTLKLNGCRKLKMLPSNMQDLVNLRHLDIRQTRLEEMPKGMNKLKGMQFLSGYVVGNHEENGIKELGALEDLHGALSIYKLENVIDGGEALKANMNDKKHINTLYLRWSSNGETANSLMEREILDNLQPHTNLEEILIDGYEGTTLSDWLGHSSYRNMTGLTLEGCRNCCILPSIGQLPSLKILCISKCDELKIIGAEFYKSDEPCMEAPFPSLETLILERMPRLREWHSHELGSFPRLRRLEIRHCPMLRGDLPHHLPALELLNIQGCKQLSGSLPRAPVILKMRISGEPKVRLQGKLPFSLNHLFISGSQLVESVFEAMPHSQPNSPNLQYLYIFKCSSTISFPGSCVPPSLQYLEIHDCRNLEFPMLQRRHESLLSLSIYDSCDSLTSFPAEAFPNLRELTIRRCKNLRSLQVTRLEVSCLPSLCLLKIFDCPSFVSLLSLSQDVASFPSLRDLTIRKCPGLVSLSMIRVAAPGLENLTIQRCPEIDLSPEEGLPPKLRNLHIVECNGLMRWIASMDLRSHCLTQLGIEGACESVKSFPKEGCLPASLESLSLSCFPSLETFDCAGLLHLTSLVELNICDCPKLEFVVGKRALPASLTQLNINQCPLLGKEEILQLRPKFRTSLN